MRKKLVVKILNEIIWKSVGRKVGCIFYYVKVMGKAVVNC